MDQRSKRRCLLLRATAVPRCKVYQPGDEIAICGRQFLASTMSPAHCSYLGCNLRPLIEAIEKGINISTTPIRLDGGTFVCRDYDCEGRFAVYAMSDEEVAAARATAGTSGVQMPQEAPAKMEPLSTPPATSTAPAPVPAPSPASAQAPKPTPAAPTTAEPATPPPSVPPAKPKADAPAPAAKPAPAAPAEAQDKPSTFLARLPTEEAHMLLAAGTEQAFPPDTPILSQGDVGHALYVIWDGEVKVVKDATGSHPIELARLGMGEAFGEMSLLSGEPINATVSTTVETTLVVVSSDALDEVMTGNPNLHRAFSKLFMKRLQATNFKLEEKLAEGMRGKLSMINLMELVQSLLMSQKTGTVQIDRKDLSGTLILKKGQVRGAKVGNLEGEQAFRELVQFRDGEFTFLQQQREDLTENIKGDTMHLLMEAARVLDEAPGDEPPAAP